MRSLSRPRISLRIFSRALRFSNSSTSALDRPASMVFFWSSSFFSSDLYSTQSEDFSANSWSIRAILEERRSFSSVRILLFSMRTSCWLRNSDLSPFFFSRPSISSKSFSFAPSRALLSFWSFASTSSRSALRPETSIERFDRSMDMLRRLSEHSCTLDSALFLSIKTRWTVSLLDSILC